jgi:hypothetical protein
MPCRAARLASWRACVRTYCSVAGGRCGGSARGWPTLRRVTAAAVAGGLVRRPWPVSQSTAGVELGFCSLCFSMLVSEIRVRYLPSRRCAVSQVSILKGSPRGRMPLVSALRAGCSLRELACGLVRLHIAWSWHG